MEMATIAMGGFIPCTWEEISQKATWYVSISNQFGATKKGFVVETKSNADITGVSVFFEITVEETNQLVVLQTWKELCANNGISRYPTTITTFIN